MPKSEPAPETPNRTIVFSFRVTEQEKDILDEYGRLLERTPGDAARQVCLKAAREFLAEQVD